MTATRVDLRCQRSGNVFGVVADGRIEVRCRSERCGGRNQGQLVFHTFDLATGELIGTRTVPKKETRQCLTENSAAV